MLRTLRVYSDLCRREIDVGIRLASRGIEGCERGPFGGFAQRQMGWEEKNLTISAVE